MKAKVATSTGIGIKNCVGCSWNNGIDCGNWWCNESQSNCENECSEGGTNGAKWCGPETDPADACTGDGGDVWSTGSEVSCCAGLEKYLTHDYRWLCRSGSDPAPAPGGSSPTNPPDAPSPWNGQKFWVLSGNMQWVQLYNSHRDGNNGSVGRLYRDALNSGKKIDLGGFQECRDIGRVLRWLEPGESASRRCCCCCGLQRHSERGPWPEASRRDRGGSG